VTPEQWDQYYYRIREDLIAEDIGEDVDELAETETTEQFGPRPEPTPAQHRRMHALWRKAGVTDRAARLALTSAAIGRSVTTSNGLTEDEAEQLITYMSQLQSEGRLADAAAGYLAQLEGTPS
jgi:hypothetical protein